MKLRHKKGGRFAPAGAMKLTPYERMFFKKLAENGYITDHERNVIFRILWWRHFPNSVEKILLYDPIGSPRMNEAILNWRKFEEDAMHVPFGYSVKEWARAVEETEKRGKVI